MIKVILNDIINIISGGTPKTTIEEYWKDGTVGWLSVNDFNNDNRYVYDSEKKITELGVEKSNTKYLNRGDIIISARGTVGALAQIGKPMCFNQSCFGLRGKEGIVDTDFLYYSLKNYVRNIIKRSQGSVFNTINLASFELMELEIPETIDTQKQIAKVLSDLDAKIEVNNKINQELEALAKTIYDYWFVQFDFPDQNGKPYKSSGGKMEYNEELKREIPEGWEVKMLNKIFEFEKGKEPGSAEYVNKKVDENYIKFFRVGNIDGISDTFIDSTKQDYLYASEGDVIVTFDGSVGKVGIGINGIYSSGLRKIYSISDEIHSSFIYFVFKDERIIKTIHKYSTGSIILHASKSIDFLNIFYHKETIEKYQNFINPFYEKIVYNLKENQKLAALRDWLLPMLMNGQVTVGEAKEQLGMVAEEEEKYNF